ncbi:MAG: hypothetical protein JST92_17755 [Deltaproteobacteria bacterium]|nr:hypothetical protein [Deltaproteobacteria bacterium]
MTRLPRLLSPSAAWAVLALGLALPAAAAPSNYKYRPGLTGRAAVLLIHGLASSSRHFTDPGSAWSIKDGHFDHRSSVDSSTGTSEHLKAGLDSVGLSPVDQNADAAHSFASKLNAFGFGVATWDQVPCMDDGSFPTDACLDGDTFDAAWPSTLAAFDQLAADTAQQKLPLALIGHSRGGRLARKLLKVVVATKRPGWDRVRWLITLHTPHHGSSMATQGAEFQKALGSPGKALDLDIVPKVVRDDVSKAVSSVTGGLNGSINALVKIAGLRGARELAQGGAIYKDIEKDEVKVPKVQVLTFGGDSPRIAYGYAYVYTAESAEPHKVWKKMGAIKRPGTEYHWESKPHRILDFPAGLGSSFPELKPGGDLLVTDSSSHFGFEDQHVTESYNHAEVLWASDVQATIVTHLLLP